MVKKIRIISAGEIARSCILSLPDKQQRTDVVKVWFCMDAATGMRCELQTKGGYVELYTDGEFDFGSWEEYAKCVAAEEPVKLNYGSGPPTMQAPSTCPDCYDTGRYHGWGGPCPKGCMP